MECAYDPATTYCAYRVEARLKGEWVIHDRPSLQYGCNICGNLTSVNSNFCPNCGAPMTEEAFRKYNGLKCDDYDEGDEIE